jgi:hypothetical protein
VTRSPLTLAVLVSLLLSAPLALAADPVPKQLNGPAEEFNELRAPDPADSAVFSHSALLPVEMSADESGKARWSSDLPVENGRVRYLVFSGTNADWQLQMTSPSGRRVLAAELTALARPTDFAMQEASLPATYYALDDVESGTWRLNIDAGSSRSHGGFVLLEGDKSTELMSYPAHRRHIVGEQQTVVATLGAPRAGRSSEADTSRISTAQLRVTAPDNSITYQPMFDDGQHGDALANDGLFGATFAATASGNYVAQVIAQGRNAAGAKVLRSAEHVLPVVEASLRLSHLESLLTASNDGGTRMTFHLPVVATRANQHYRAYAQLWGRDAKGRELPVAWMSGMVTPDNGRLPLGFDSRWMDRVKAEGPFELRDVRIEDPDHFVTLASASRMAVYMPSRPRSVGEAATAIDDTMRMGPRPSPERVATGVGQRLILVHGYCSGGVWPAAQFTTASSFLDVNQNRSHDQFARLLQAYGNTWNSFGTVAHSQGGAASLHLYHYYWSGLDNATGARLIQSVGTPYKGTNLAGILATLGSWFGVGCGTNDNLSYSGASAWLAGIPNASRAKVNYYTTAFRTTNWWTNDYCQIATDLVLSDPEDGTTEQANGQLPGATNRGHTTGQCHTSGMRDPAQYLDSARNSTMNTNAAR